MTLPDSPVDPVRISTPGFDDGLVFSSLFSAYPDALLLVDAHGMIVLANPAAVTLLGYSADELAGLSVDALVPDAIRPRHADYRNAYASHPRARPMGTQMDLVAKRRDGSEVMVEIALSPLHDHGLPYVVAAIRNVGAYPRVKQALQRARYAEYLAQFGRLAVDAREPQSMLDQVPLIAAQALQVEMAKVLMLEPDGLALQVAAGVGLAPQEQIGARIAHRTDWPCGHVVAHGVPVRVDDYTQEQRFVAPAGCLEAGLVSELAVPLSDRGRTIGALVVRSRMPQRFGDDEARFLDSLSSLLATILQRARSEEALSHSQRLESVGQLTGGIAHDFNNLLTVISGNLQVLEEAPAYANDPFIQQIMGAAMRATRRGAELTGKLLAFSRRQILQPTVLDAGALLHSLTDMLRRTLDQHIAITLETDDALCMADPVQLESALLNIAINARDAMPQGGLLSFTCRTVTSLPAGVDADLDTSRGESAAMAYVAIAISDNGGGMSEAIKEHVFEPFFTTKAAGRGTGLGLSTVYGFARQSRGAVSLSSALGVGTTVTLYLPSAREDAPDRDLDGERVVDGASGGVPAGLRVLLVEDDLEVQSVVRQFLATMGCAVVACTSGEQALGLLTLESGPDADVDLVLTDVALGVGMRGTDLADQVRTRQPGLPILLMSGFARELPDTTGSRDLLHKPFTRAELEHAIVRVLADT